MTLTATKEDGKFELYKVDLHSHFFFISSFSSIYTALSKSSLDVRAICSHITSPYSHAYSTYSNAKNINPNQRVYDGL